MTAIERVPATTSVIDVLDHVLDKGIVIDAWMRLSLVGISLITVEARVVVASIETYLKHAISIGEAGPFHTSTELPCRSAQPTTRAADRSLPRRWRRQPAR